MQQTYQTNLSATEEQALYARYESTNNRRWQERIRCVLLAAQGLSLDAIGELIPCQLNTLGEWLRAYDERGIEGLEVWRYGASPMPLTVEQQAEVRSHVSHHRYRRVKDVQQWVETTWQVTYHEDGIRELLHSLGFSYKQGQIVLGKPGRQAQALFFEGDG
jgi:transposase